MSARGNEAAVTPEETRARVRGLLGDLQPESVQAAFAGDPEFTRDVIEALPGLHGSYLKLVKALAGYVQGLPPDERAELVGDLVTGLDSEAVVEAANTLSSLVITIHRENPDLAALRFPAIEAEFAGIDFGKLRESVAVMADYYTAVVNRSLDVAGENPVIMANIVGMLPPLLNGMIRVISHLIDSMNLPPEILASALFNVLSSLDAEEIGRAMSRLSDQVNDLHAGNLILGRDEPRLRAVFTDFTKRILDNLDVEAVSGAMVAVGEDIEVIVDSLLELVSRDPELVLQVSRTTVSLANIAARIVSSSFNELDKWPAETYARIGENLRENLDTTEIGKAIDSWIMFSRNLREANPHLTRELLSGAIQAINTERLELQLLDVSKDMKHAVLANAGVRKALEPAELGRRINDSLVAFNRSAAGRPGAVRDYLTELLGAIDSKEFEAAVRTVSSGVTDAMFSSVERGMAVLKPALAGGWKFLRFIGSFLKNKLLGGVGV